MLPYFFLECYNIGTVPYYWADGGPKWKIVEKNENLISVSMLRCVVCISVSFRAYVYNASVHVKVLVCVCVCVCVLVFVQVFNVFCPTRPPIVATCSRLVKHCTAAFCHLGPQQKQSLLKNSLPSPESRVQVSYKAGSEEGGESSAITVTLVNNTYLHLCLHLSQLV